MIVIVKQDFDKKQQQENNLNQILENSHATLIDGSMLPDMARVDLHNNDVEALKTNLGEGWIIVPEIKYSVPDTKRKVIGKKLIH